MSVAVESQEAYDLGDIPLIVRSSIKLGIIQGVMVFVFSLVSRYLSGAAEFALGAVIVLVGVAATAGLPALWTRARTGAGIAVAAGIGLGATATFMAMDVVLLQRIGTYTNRWLEIGGGSNWWYHPVWWMAGTYLAWMGAVIMAKHSERSGASIPGMMIPATIAGVVVGGIAVLIHFPGAGWNLGTFGVALLPGFALAALLSTVTRRRA
jgi:hypothetical protein